MANYFTHYPKLFYNKILVTDILSRVAIRADLVDKLSLFYPYYLRDGDTPEIIAFKYYKDPEKHWIVLMSNEIIDPFFDWPLNAFQFEKYLNDKYYNEGVAIGRTGLEYSQITVKGYRATITTSDSFSMQSHSETFEIDELAYSSQYPDDTFDYADTTIQKGDVTYTQTKSSYTIYEYENELNENRRNIRLLKKEYVSKFEEEFKQLNSIQFL